MPNPTRFSGMSGLNTSSLLTRLSKVLPFEWQMIFYGYASHNYHAIERGYDAILERLRRNLGDVPKSAARQAPEVKTITQNHGVSHWDWRRVPYRHYLVDVYEIFSTIYMSYCLIKYTFPQWFELGAQMLDLQLSAHCYLLGRFKLHPAIDDSTVICISMVHVVWRCYQRLRVYYLQMFYFMLFSGKDLERYRQIIINNSIDYGSLDEFGQPLGESVKVDEELKFFFDDVMSFTMYEGGELVRKIRPNRTEEARASLKNWASFFFILLTSIFFTIAIVILYTTLDIFTDKFYVDRYAGCDKYLEAEMRNNSPNLSYTRLSSIHRLMALLFDFLENFILWVETGIAFMFGLEFACMLNYDLLIYCNHLKSRVIEILELIMFEELNYYRSSVLATGIDFKAESASLLKELSLNPRPSHGTGVSRHSAADWWNLDYLHRFQLRRAGKLSEGRSVTSAGQSVYSLLGFWLVEQRVRRLVAELQDFFQLVRKVDVYMTQVLVLTISCWLAILTTYMYIYQVKRDQDFPMVFYLILLFAVNLVIIISLTLLSLHRSCMLIYPNFCSLIARYPANNKDDLLTIWRYFSDRKTCYFIMGLYPFLPTTFLSIFGWSFSCFFIVAGLVGNH